MKTIALTMIVKNEARSIARCLDSVAPWVDRMIVLDTGSTDDTMAIARAHGAEVYERRWTNDFAAARNAALAKSDADWNLVLDADEWLTSGGEYLQGLKQDGRRVIHNIRVDSDLGRGQSTLISSHRIPRILPKGVRYKGRIHEQPAHSLPVVDSTVSVRHDGYMQEQLDTKKGRNLELLLQELAERPNDPYVNFQIGKQYDIQLQPAEAIPYYRKAHQASSVRTVWHHDMAVRMIECLRQTGRLEEAMLFASDEMRYFEDSSDFYFVVGCLLLDQMQKHPEQGETLLPMIEESWLKALQNARIWPATSAVAAASWRPGNCGRCSMPARKWTRPATTRACRPTCTQSTARQPTGGWYRRRHSKTRWQKSERAGVLRGDGRGHGVMPAQSGSIAARSVRVDHVQRQQGAMDAILGLGGGHIVGILLHVRVAIGHGHGIAGLGQHLDIVE